MKATTCFYIVGSLCTVLAISLYFAYIKKQQEKQEKQQKTKESFRGGGGSSGVALRYGGGGTAGGPPSGAPIEENTALCRSNADCGGRSPRCGSNGFCV